MVMVMVIVIVIEIERERRLKHTETAKRSYFTNFSSGLITNFERSKFSMGKSTKSLNFSRKYRVYRKRLKWMIRIVGSFHNSIFLKACLCSLHLGQYLRSRPTQKMNSLMMSYYKGKDRNRERERENNIEYQGSSGPKRSWVVKRSRQSNNVIVRGFFWFSRFSETVRWIVTDYNRKELIGT